MKRKLDSRLMFLLLLAIWPLCLAVDTVQLIAVIFMSTNENFMSVIAGFTVRIQCSIVKCGHEKATIAWYKDDLLLFNGTDFQLSSGIDPGNIVLQFTTSPDPSQRSCTTEEFTLLLRNLTIQDAGKYRCQLHRQLQQLDFQIDVLENGLKPGFGKNIDYDIMGCCVEQGLSPICRAMCKPKEMDFEFFDPTSCKTKDYKSFLMCATDGGKFDFIPCCRQRSVPSFCYDFCSFNFDMLKRSHRLCLYYLPEIFECFSQKQPQPPKAPKNVQIRQARHKLLCWSDAEESEEKIEFSVHVREIPVLAIPEELNNDRRSPLPESRHSRRRIGRATKSKPTVIVAHDSSHRDQTDFVRLDSDQIEQDNDEICISLAGLRKGLRYVFYVQSTNKFGSSNPSAAIFSVI